MKKLFFYVLTLFLICSGMTVEAKNKEIECENEVNIYIFHGSTCPHCQAALEFFDSIEEEYGKCFNLNKFEVWSNSDNAALMQNVAAYFGEEVSGVPYIIIGENTFKGYSESSDEKLKNAIVEASNDTEYVDVLDAINSGTVNNVDNSGSSIATVLLIGLFVGGIAALIITNKKNKNE